MNPSSTSHRTSLRRAVAALLALLAGCAATPWPRPLEREATAQAASAALEAEAAALEAEAAALEARTSVAEAEHAPTPEHALARACSEYHGSATKADDVARVRSFGRGWLLIESYALTPPAKGARAAFESMTFRACLTWPEGPL